MRALHVGQGQAAPVPKPGPVTPSVATNRTWAREKGYDVGKRGRILDYVREALLDAHPKLGMGEFSPLQRCRPRHMTCHAERVTPTGLY